jgi:hypothetical protein
VPAMTLDSATACATQLHGLTSRSV